MLTQTRLRMPGTPRPKRPSQLLPNETAYVMTGFGGSMTEREHVIRRIRAHKPNRYAEQVREWQREAGEPLVSDEEYEAQVGFRDLMGYITYESKTVRVVTGGYQDVEVWRIDHMGEWESE